MKKYDRNEGGTSPVAMNLSSFLNITELMLKFAQLRKKVLCVINPPSIIYVESVILILAY